MKTLITIAVAVVMTLALTEPAWAGGRHGHRDGNESRHEYCPPPPDGPDADGDGRISSYERIQWERRQRYERQPGA